METAEIETPKKIFTLLQIDWRACRIISPDFPDSAEMPAPGYFFFFFFFFRRLEKFSSTLSPKSLSRFPRTPLDVVRPSVVREDVVKERHAMRSAEGDERREREDKLGRVLREIDKDLARDDGSGAISRLDTLNATDPLHQTVLVRSARDSFRVNGRFQVEKAIGLRRRVRCAMRKPCRLLVSLFYPIAGLTPVTLGDS